MEVAADCAHLSGDAVLRGEGGFTTGALWTGGFAFHDEGTEAGVDPAWSSFEPATMILPELAIQSSDAGNFITVNLMAGPGADPAALADSALVRIAGLVHPELPMIDPTRPSQLRSRACSPGDYEQSVAAAVERIRAGRSRKWCWPAGGSPVRIRT